MLELMGYIGVGAGGVGVVDAGVHGVTMQRFFGFKIVHLGERNDGRPGVDKNEISPTVVGDVVVGRVQGHDVQDCQIG